MPKRYLYDLREPRIPAAIGNKAENLRFLIRHKLPVPNTWVCTWDMYLDHQSDGPAALERLRSELAGFLKTDCPYAVRSSANVEDDPARVRRLVSEAKKFSTDSCWQIINNAMQIMGGIGYTNVYPIERFLRDARLLMIWTGSNQIMDLVIQHEYYREMGVRQPARDVEADAPDADKEEEKVYE